MWIKPLTAKDKTLKLLEDIMKYRKISFKRHKNHKLLRKRLIDLNIFKLSKEYHK